MAVGGWRGVFFFFNDTATTEIYTLSLHDALPISEEIWTKFGNPVSLMITPWPDRKSTRLNSSHITISYAVFCLKKKKTPTHLYIPSGIRSNGIKKIHETANS